jgi:hypothetical protein
VLIAEVTDAVPAARLLTGGVRLRFGSSWYRVE